MLKAKQFDKGFSLVELMVSMTIGLVILSAAMTFFTGNLRASNTTLEMARLNQELQTVVTMIVRDIRLAGYNGQAIYGDTSNTFKFKSETDSDLGSDNATGDSACIILKTDLNGNGKIKNNSDEYDDNEISGYKLDGSVIDKLKTAEKCSDENGWEVITSDDIEINLFNLSFSTEQIEGDKNIYIVDIQIEGQVADKPALNLSFNQTVRMRNNMF